MNNLKNKINQLQADKDQLMKDLRTLKNPAIKSESEAVAELHAKVEWYDLFVDYIYDQDKNKYNEACEYADNNQFKV
jgi:hypothetical protein